MTKQTKKTTRRTQAKELPKQQKKLTPKEAKQVKGGGLGLPEQPKPQPQTQPATVTTQTNVNGVNPAVIPMAD